jgi:hypothetical protein
MLKCDAFQTGLPPRSRMACGVSCPESRVPMTQDS